VSREHTFALCLTHDVDRPYKTYQAPYYAVRERSLYHLKTALPSENPYWQFDEIRQLESELGVRSAFYFLNEPSILEKKVSDLVRPGSLLEHAGRYLPTDPAIAETIRELDEGGWEVGLHGSTAAYDDRSQLGAEKQKLEMVLENPVVGNRQHHLRTKIPETWEHANALGFNYDTSLGFPQKSGFHFGYQPIMPFDDEFVVFPLTAMEVSMAGHDASFEERWTVCERLLREAAANDAVMTVLWHARYFNEREFPGYRRLYRRLIERALEMDAWVGPPRELYQKIQTREPEASDPIDAHPG